MKHVPKVWGSELWIVNTDQYCGKRFELRRGFQCSLHCHHKKDETFFVAAGKVRLELNGAVHELLPGHSVRIMPGDWHRFAGLEDSVIFEFSTSHDEADVFRREPSREM